MKTGLRVQGEAMVGQDRLETGDAGQQRLPPAAVAGEVVRYDAPRQDDHLRLQDAPVEEDRRAGARGAEALEVAFVPAIVGHAADDRVGRYRRRRDGRLQRRNLHAAREHERQAPGAVRDRVSIGSSSGEAGHRQIKRTVAERRGGDATVERTGPWILSSYWASK